MKPPPLSESKAQSGVLGAVFFISGAVALMYEAAWQRQFTLLFGSAAPATAAVLAAYFAGLGLGSWLLGKWGARCRRPLQTYAALELLIAAGALLVAPLLSLYAGYYPELFAWGQNRSGLLFAAKCLLAFAAIVIPAAAMGGTLPVLAQLFENRRDRLGDLAGRLYMLNTAGAALGILLFPSLLRMAGMRQSVWLLAGVNLVLGAVALVLGKSLAPAPVAPPVKVKPGAAGFRLWLGLAFASGFVTFVLQVGWSRLFAQTHENSVHSFSVIVALFIAAIATGAQVARVLLRRKWDPEGALRRLWMIGGLLTLLASSLFPALTGGLKYVEGSSVIPWSLPAMAMLVIFLPVVPLAAGLPLILQKISSLTPRTAGEVTGTVFAWNIAGSVTGALCAGFLFPHLLGLQGTQLLAGAIAIVCTAFIAPRKCQRHRVGLGLALAVVIAGFTFSRPLIRLDEKRGEKLLAIKEGPYGVTAVVEIPGSRKLKLNNHYGLGGSASAADERMQAHIPLLLHPRAESVAFLGYGTGISAGASFFHAPDEVTALELVPEAADLAGQYFAAENNRFSTQPGARLVIEDARNFLRGTPQRFDVIIGDLVVPWRQGEGALYTLEHFQAARSRLADGGLYCAWLPLFQMGEEDFLCILRTFLEVFPRATAWRGDFYPDTPALALIGFSAADFDPSVVSRRLAVMQQDPLNRHLTHAATFWMHYIGPVSRGQAGDGPVNTEDCPRVELRIIRPPPFTGREFQEWEYEVRRVSTVPALPPEALAGQEAGRLMGEFTLLYSERRPAEASAVQKKVVHALGPDAARGLFPP
jgi:spermidine synthase